MRDFWLINELEYINNEVYQSINTLNNVSGTISWSQGIAYAYKATHPLRASNSKNSIPTTGNLGDFSNSNSGVDETAENRPYNFCVRMYMKL